MIKLAFQGAHARLFGSYLNRTNINEGYSSENLKLRIDIFFSLSIPIRLFKFVNHSPYLSSVDFHGDATLKPISLDSFSMVVSVTRVST